MAWTSDQRFISRGLGEAPQQRGARLTMAFEYPSAAGTVAVAKVRRGWRIVFAGHRHGHWSSPDEAVKAAARHRSGLNDWDRQRAAVSEDLLDWRPLGDSL